MGTRILCGTFSRAKVKNVLTLHPNRCIFNTSNEFPLTQWENKELKAE